MFLFIGCCWQECIIVKDLYKLDSLAYKAKAIMCIEECGDVHRKEKQPQLLQSIQLDDKLVTDSLHKAV